ncbi:hypothetical protein ACQJBY_029159 [Aegilops geniculata]
MSDEGSCEGEMADENLHRASQNSAQSGDPAVPPAPTSHLLVKHADRRLEVIQAINEFKRFLVTSIGVGGMLNLQMHTHCSPFRGSQAETTAYAAQCFQNQEGCPA